MGLSRRIARRRDEKIEQELISQFDGLRSAGWNDLNAVHTVFDLAKRMNASPTVLQAICTYAPIRKTIEANPDDLELRSFLDPLDPDMTFHFPE